MQKITPFLWFDKDAKEAIDFYVATFNTSPGKKSESEVVKIKYYPPGITEGPMAGMDGKVLTGVFTLEGQTFMCLDGGPLFKPNESMSFLIECKTQEEIDHYWNAFTKEGQESQCGWCKDKWGFSWQVCPSMEQFFTSPDSEANGRAMQAMLAMKKIDIAKLQEAFDNK
jgi:predicted 3-demethylubiquinone-9 3-methyltransferase (glyoxalase superfamily)